jgi:hypothetical protein
MGISFKRPKLKDGLKDLTKVSHSIEKEDILYLKNRLISQKSRLSINLISSPIGEYLVEDWSFDTTF